MRHPVSLGSLVFELGDEGARLEDQRPVHSGGRRDFKARDRKWDGLSLEVSAQIPSVALLGEHRSSGLKQPV